MNHCPLNDSKYSLDVEANSYHIAHMQNATGSQANLQKISSIQNTARFYVITIEADLFGVWLLTRNWGRIGYYGQSKHQCFKDQNDAQAMFTRHKNRKLNRGYLII